MSSLNPHSSCDLLVLSEKGKVWPKMERKALLRRLPRELDECSLSWVSTLSSPAC